MVGKSVASGILSSHELIRLSSGKKTLQLLKEGSSLLTRPRMIKRILVWGLDDWIDDDVHTFFFLFCLFRLFFFFFFSILFLKVG